MATVLSDLKTGLEKSVPWTPGSHYKGGASSASDTWLIGKEAPSALNPLPLPDSTLQARWTHKTGPGPGTSPHIERITCFYFMQLETIPPKGR
jgi:hypothetical protein